MKNKTFGQKLIDGLNSAKKYEAGKISLNTSSLALPDKPKVFKQSEVKKIREKLNLSQPVMARYLGVSDNAVKSWEQGGSRPSGSALRLLQIAKDHPEDFFKLIS